MMLHALCNYGVKKINVRKFIAALFEDGAYDKDQPGESALDELAQELREAFPFADVASDIRRFSSKTDLKEYAYSLKSRSRRYKMYHPIKANRIRHLQKTPA